MKNFMNSVAYFLLFVGIFCVVSSPLYTSSKNIIKPISEDLLPKVSSSKFVFNTSHTQEELETLNKNLKITHLDLRAISPQLAPLALFREPFFSVKELYIGRLSFIDQILEELPKCMPKLSILVLDNSSVTSSSFQFLHSLSQLEVLRLSQVNITKEKHVTDLLQKNSKLSIYVTPLKYPTQSIPLSTFTKEPRVIKVSA